MGRPRENWKVQAMKKKQKELKERSVVLAPLREEQCYFKEKKTTHFRDFHVLGGMFSWGAFSKLYRQPPSNARPPIVVPPELMPRPNARASWFERFPREVVHLILGDAGSSRKDIISLGLCSKTSWMQILDYIQLVCQSGPWVDTPIISNVRLLDSLPDNLYPYFVDLQARNDKFASEPTPLSHYDSPMYDWRKQAVATYQRVEGFGTCEWWLPALAAATTNKKRTKVCRRELEALRGLLAQALPISFVGSNPVGEECGKSTWYLRNLDTHQFVVLEADGPEARQDKEPDCGQRPRRRGEDCRDGVEKVDLGVEVHVAGHRWFSLDKLILFKTIWASSRLESLFGRPSGSPLLPCHWAGHRFDVVADESLVAGEKWEDFTAAIVCELEDVEPEKFYDMFGYYYETGGEMED